MPTLLYLPQCASTNDEIVRYLTESQPEFLGLYTLNQTNGRGQYGNIWKINPGENLAFTIAISAKVLPSHIGINFYTANLIRSFIAKLTDTEVHVKWPNDIIVHHKKVCGILVDKKKISGQEYYIIGAGINILQTDFQDFKKAGSLFTQTGKTYNPKDVATDLFTLFSEKIFEEKNPNQILDEFNAHLFRRNEVSVFQKNGIRQNGIIKYADTDGFLWINLEKDGLQKFFNKEIEMLY